MPTLVIEQMFVGGAADRVGAGEGRLAHLPPADPVSGYDPATDTLPIGDALTALLDQRNLTDDEIHLLEGRTLARLVAKGFRQARASEHPARAEPRVEQPTLC